MGLYPAHDHLRPIIIPGRPDLLTYACTLQTPGNALAVSPNMPFRGLEMFGNGFLSKFMGAQLDSPLLHHVTLIDTPGILSGATVSLAFNLERSVNYNCYVLASSNLSRDRPHP